MSMKRIAIFASGTGSNATRIVDYFDPVADIEVGLIVSNRANAGVLTMAEDREIPSMIIDRTYFYDSNQILFELKHRCIDLIVLAGFLWLVPSYLVHKYKDRMVNIHPALLPKYGGKGMYGMHVHQAVKDKGERESGITIHYVNEKFDDGAIIYQASCHLDPEDSPGEIREKVLQLEHQYFAPVIEKILRDQPVVFE